METFLNTLSKDEIEQAADKLYGLKSIYPKCMFIGIDPGINGAIAGISSGGQLSFVYDMPKKQISLNEKSTAINLAVGRFCEIIKGAADKGCLVAIEQAVPYRSENIKSLMTFGLECGAIIAILETMGMNYSRVNVHEWHKIAKPSLCAKEPAYAELIKSGVKKAKAESVIAASKMYGTNVLYTQRGALKDGRADAILIALYAYGVSSGIKSENVWRVIWGDSTEGQKDVIPCELLANSKQKECGEE